jgi:hypothetical protein
MGATKLFAQLVTNPVDWPKDVSVLAMKLTSSFMGAQKIVLLQG